MKLEEIRAKAQIDYNKFAVDRSAQLQEVDRIEITRYFVSSAYSVYFFILRLSAPVRGCVRRVSSGLLQTCPQP